MRDTVIITGLGTLGREVMRQLATVPNLKIVGCDISEDQGRKSCQNIKYLSYSNGYNPEIIFEPLDLLNIIKIKKIIKKHDPDLVFQSGTAFSNRLFDQISDNVRQTLLERAGMGWLAPMHLQFPIQVAKALDELGRLDKTFFVNASFPDVVNPVLDRMDLTPDCGVGNLGTFLPVFRTAAARRLNVPRRDVELYIAMAHGVATKFWDNQSTEGGPYYLKACQDCKDVTEAVDGDDQLGKEGWPEIPQLGGSISIRRPLVASNAKKILVGLLHDTNKIVHGPAPNGRVGGWPFHISQSGAEIVVPSGTTEEKLAQVNSQGLEIDGIKKITDDGTIVYLESSVELLEETIGYNCRSLHIHEIKDRKTEINSILEDMIRRN